MTTDVEEQDFYDYVYGLAVEISEALSKTYWLRLITALAMRLSLVASVWLFIFDRNLWVGMPLFLILTILIGGIQDVKFPGKVK